MIRSKISDKDKFTHFLASEAKQLLALCYIPANKFCHY